VYRFVTTQVFRFYVICGAKLQIKLYSNKTLTHASNKYNEKYAIVAN